VEGVSVAVKRPERAQRNGKQYDRLSAARGLGCPQAKAGSISILSVPFSRSSFKSRLRI